MYTTCVHVCGVPVEVRRGTESPGTEVMYGGESPCGYYELAPGPASNSRQSSSCLSLLSTGIMGIYAMLSFPGEFSSSSAELLGFRFFLVFTVAAWEVVRERKLFSSENGKLFPDCWTCGFPF